MNGDKRHVDGDDYTWDTPSGAAVFKSDAETIAWQTDIEALAARRFESSDLVVLAGPDLRTADQRARDDVLVLMARLELVEQLACEMADRVRQLESAMTKLIRVMEVRL